MEEGYWADAAAAASLPEYRADRDAVLGCESIELPRPRQLDSLSDAEGQYRLRRCRLADRPRRMRSRTHSTETGKYAFERGAGARESFRLDDHVPHALELLPPGGVCNMSTSAHPAVFRCRAAGDVPPPVEVPIGAPVARFELVGAHARWSEHGVAGVVEIPLAVKQPALLL